MENKDKKKKTFELLNEGRGGLSKFFQDIKVSIFEVLFVLLKEEDENLLMLYLGVSVDYIQMHYFPFSQTVNNCWKASEFLTNIFTIFNMLQVTQLLTISISFNYYLIGFYCCIGAIFLLILDIIYVSYSFSRKKFTFLWPLVVLRYIVSLFVTVLFLPINQLLLSMINCQYDDNNVYVLQKFPDIECWTGLHIIHGSLSLFMNFIFTVICTVVSLTFFENKMTSGNQTARENSNGEVVFIMNKIILQLSFNLLPEDYVWVLILEEFVLSFILYYIYNYTEPYYNFQVGKFYKIVSTYYFWTNTMLVVSKILENTGFNGGMIAWLLGLPFIGSIMSTSKKSRIETLLSSQRKFKSGEEIRAHLRYVMQLIYDQKNDRNSYMLLIGYVEKHKEICQEDDCPLKTKKSKKKHINQIGNSSMDEILNNLIKVVDRMYQNGLKKFPTNIRLRLTYAFFLLERMKLKTKALDQLLIAEKGKPEFDDQFLIYRYKKIIIENLDELGDQNSDIVSIIAFDNHISLCEEYMNKASTLHREFWGELREDRPDLSKLNSLGTKINFTVKEAKDQYQKMQKINSNVPQTIKVFGSFLINILNDKEAGSLLIERAKKLFRDKLLTRLAEKKEFDIDLDNEPTPFAVVSARKSDLGVINKVNFLFSVQYGFSKEEIQGKKINLIMAEIYSQYHDNFFSRYLNNLSSGNAASKYLEQNQNFFGKNKNGYIFPIVSKVFFYQINDDPLFIGTFRHDTSANFTTKNFIYIIVGKDGIIQDVSSTAILTLKIDTNMIKKNKLNIENYIPNWMTENAYQEKEGAEFIYPLKFDNNEKQYHYHCNIFQIKFTSVEVEDGLDDEDEGETEKKDDCFGYWLKIDRLDKPVLNVQKKIDDLRKDKREDSLDGKAFSSSIQSPVKTNKRNSQFFTLKNDLAVPLTNYEKGIEAIKEETKIEKDKHFSNFILSIYNLGDEKDTETTGTVTVKGKESDKFFETRDWGDGINTKRLVGNNIVDPRGNTEEDNQWEYEEADSVFKSLAGENFEDDDDYRLFHHSNSTKIIKEAISYNYKHAKVTLFKLASFLWVGMIICLSAIQFDSALSEFGDALLCADTIYQEKLRLDETNVLLARTYDLLLYQSGTFNESTTNLTEVQNSLRTSIGNIITSNSILTNGIYMNFLSTYQTKVSVRIFTESGKFEVQELYADSALASIYAAAFNFSNSNISSLNIDSNYVRMFLYNYHNGVYSNLKNSSLRTSQNIINKIGETDIRFIIFFIALFIFSFLLILFFIKLIVIINTERENILFLFLDIPKKHVNYLYRKCEKFLASYVPIKELIEQNDNDEYESSDEENEEEVSIIVMHNDENNSGEYNKEEDDMDARVRESQNRRKIIERYKKNKLKGKTSMFLKYFLLIIVSQIYSLFNLIGIYTLKSELEFLFPQYEQNANLIAEFQNIFNIQRMMMIDSQFPIDSDLAISRALFTLKSLISINDALQGFNQAIFEGSHTLKGPFVKLHFGNICEFLKEDLTPDLLADCEKVLRSNLKLGLENFKEELFNILEKRYIEFHSDPVKFSPILGSMDFIDIDKSLDKYVRKALKKWVSMERDYIKEKTNSSEQFQTISFVMFLFVLLFFFLFFWLPYIGKMNVEINRTIGMLNMIPIKVIKENSNIRKFVKDLINLKED